MEENSFHAYNFTLVDSESLRENTKCSPLGMSICILTAEVSADAGTFLVTGL